MAFTLPKNQFLKLFGYNFASWKTFYVTRMYLLKHHSKAFFYFLIFLPQLLFCQIEGPSLKAIEQEIDFLNEQLRQKERKEFNKEAESQNYFMADWPKYSSEVENIQQLDREEKDIEKRIEELKTKKAELQKQRSIK
jgi:hypothetical protein